jgi:hypothetical protein
MSAWLGNAPSVVVDKPALVPQWNIFGFDFFASTPKTLGYYRLSCQHFEDPAWPGNTLAATTMHAVQATGQAKLGDFSTIALKTDVKVPEPGHGDVLIRVESSSVNPVDWKLLEPGSFGPVSPIRFPHTLGFDVAGRLLTVTTLHRLKSSSLVSLADPCSFSLGTIVAVGSGCHRLKVNDTVWANLGKVSLLKLGLQLGAYAEYALADESQVGITPKSIPLAEVSPSALSPWLDFILLF